MMQGTHRVEIIWLILGFILKKTCSLFCELPRATNYSSFVVELLTQYFLKTQFETHIRSTKSTNLILSGTSMIP